MADVTSREKARGSRGMSASAFSRRAAGNLQNVVVFMQKTKGLFTFREEDPRGRIILTPYVFCTQFTCKGLYLSLALGSS